MSELASEPSELDAGRAAGVSELASEPSALDAGRTAGVSEQHPAEPAESAPTCAGCGTAAPSARDGRADGAVALTWTYQADERGARLLCPDCTRANVRSIEGRLDSAWW